VQHDHNAGRATETADPAQPLVVWGKVFAEVFIGTRHDQRIDASAVHCAAHGAEPRADLRCIHGLPLV